MMKVLEISKIDFSCFYLSMPELMNLIIQNKSLNFLEANPINYNAIYNNEYTIISII